MKTDFFGRCFAAGFLFLLILPGGLTAQTLTSGKSEWKVALAVLDLEEEGLDDPVARSTASLIPRLLLDGLSGTDTHILSPEEQELLARERIDAELKVVHRKLASYHTERDAMFFDPNTTSAELDALEQRISDSNIELRELEAAGIFSVVVPESLPVSYVDTSEGGDFLDPVTVKPESFLRTRELDLLLHGSLVHVGDYFGLKILATSPTGTDVLWEGAVSEDGLESSTLKASRAARGLLLGRPWSAIDVSVEPSDAFISIDGKIVGVGRWNATTLSPGPVSLEVTASGHLPRVENILLPESDLLSLDIILEETLQPSILVESEPVGADVRMGSIWLGRTPLAIDLPDRVMSLTFEMDGFRSRTVPFYPEAERLVVPLDIAIGDPAEEMAIRRKKLHNSMAWFSLSLAPTLVLLGVSENYAQQNLNSTDPADIEDSYNSYQLTRGLMWGSVGINVVLLTTVLFRLSGYLNAAEGLGD